MHVGKFSPPVKMFNTNQCISFQYNDYFVFEGFGMSELTVSHAYKISDHEEMEALGSCGRPLPGVKAKVGI